MKVTDLLSSATISSSRALSAYAAIVVTVVHTETPLSRAPALSFINAEPRTLYWLALALLVFLGIAHLANLLNDSFDRDRTYWEGELEGGKRMYMVYEGEEPERLPTSFGVHDKEQYLVLKAMHEADWNAHVAAMRLSVTEWVVRTVMHTAVPGLLFVIASTALVMRINDCYGGPCA